MNASRTIAERLRQFATELENATIAEIRLEESDLPLDSGTMSFVSWSQFAPYLGKCINLKPEEKLVGFTVGVDGIKCRIRYKKPGER